MSRTSLMSMYMTPPTADIPSGLPSWVFGGNYNQVEQDILGLNQQRNQIALQQQAQEQNELAIAQRERQEAFQNALSERFGQSPPASLRDMYTGAQEIALQTGMAGEAIDFAQALEREREQERAREIQLITSGPTLMRAGMEDAWRQMLTSAGKNPDDYITDQTRAYTQRILSNAGTKYILDEDGNPVPILSGPDRTKAPKTDTYFNPQTQQFEELPEGAAGRNIALRKKLVAVDSNFNAEDYPAGQNQSPAPESGNSWWNLGGLFADSNPKQTQAQQALADSQAAAPPMVTPVPTATPPATVGGLYDGKKVVRVTVKQAPAPTAAARR